MAETQTSRWLKSAVALSILGVASVVSVRSEDLAAPPVAADVIFVNGIVITMDPAAPVAQALAVAGDRILAVGSAADIAGHTGDDTVAIDLAGRTVLPGFVDAHSHLFGERILHGGDPLEDQEQIVALGVTTTAEFYVDQRILDELQALALAGSLRLRVNAYLLATNNCGEPLGDWWKAYRPNSEIAPGLFVRGVKIFTDGGSCKAPAMSVEYPGGGTGDLFFSQEALNAVVAEVDAAGFQAAIHALGDRAVEQAQNAIAATLAGRRNTPRHRIEHNATIRPEMLPRYGEIGIVPVIFGTYPTCIRTVAEGAFKYLLPAAYGAWDWPWRALVDANPGLPIAWQADYPIFGLAGPIRDMWGMVTRKAIAADGSICEPPKWLAAGALRIGEVLPMMTTNAAYALFAKKDVGSLEPGKHADLVVLSANPLEVATDDLKDIEVLMTMIGGRVEYCAPSAGAVCAGSAPVDGAGEEAPAGAIVAHASRSLPDAPPAAAIDGDNATHWSAGAHPEQWILLDLGREIRLSGVRLAISQHPEGETVHQVWAGANEEALVLLHEFRGFTQEPATVALDLAEPVDGVRYLRIVTKASPSWVAWREIEVLADGGGGR